MPSKQNQWGSLSLAEMPSLYYRLILGFGTSGVVLFLYTMAADADSRWTGLTTEFTGLCFEAAIIVGFTGWVQSSVVKQSTADMRESMERLIVGQHTELKSVAMTHLLQHAGWWMDTVLPGNPQFNSILDMRLALERHGELPIPEDPAAVGVALRAPEAYLTTFGQSVRRLGYHHHELYALYMLNYSFSAFFYENGHFDHARHHMLVALEHAYRFDRMDEEAPELLRIKKQYPTTGTDIIPGPI